MSKAKDSQKNDNQAPQQADDQTPKAAPVAASDTERLEILEGAIKSASDMVYPAFCGRAVSFDKEGGHVYGSILSLDERMELFKQAFASLDEALAAIE